MLKINQVVSGYGDIKVLKGISLHVNEGEIVGILGANGVGKTTLLKTISNLIKTREGTITYLGQEIQNSSPHKLISMGIAHVPQGRHIFSKMSVIENLQISMDHANKKSNGKDRLSYVFDLFPRLKERLKQLGGTLSGGEQQMLAIARALVAGPKLILLDEPSMGLAPLVVQSMFETIQQIAKDGTTILLVEQNAVAALEIVQRLYVMDMGRTVYESQQITNQELDKIKEVYLGMSVS
ncbi:ATP-binding cassette domain-containing protein [Terrilactibacillus sp. BCM23-1]|uniref:ATP-binding cassette domain-containing protein n=1 Tax=Terrilactibacillus tamarindi TaxID=2599694 RepID=A0A6N8CPF6_9BACI|nr:ABC transporter ATP-binding protein [Terrilactibacillus tamarindi]MTT31027.1 ATP-binding cassette domain-containing protein [Terrilactibacillus tamarindi]